MTPLAILRDGQRESGDAITDPENGDRWALCWVRMPRELRPRCST